MAKITDQRKSDSVVMVVDDDVSVRLIIRSTLELANYNVAEADNGFTALEVFESVLPDMVLLDIMMPEMDGFEVCKGLRTIPQGQHTPILIMTGLDDTESIERAYEVGATDFVTKPINYLLLKYRVNYALRAKQTADALRRSEIRLSSAQRLAKMGHWEWDRTVNIVHSSRGVEEIFGDRRINPFINVDRFLGCVHCDDRELARYIIERGIREGRNYSLPLRIVRPDGTECVVYQETEIHLGENGSVLGAIGTVQDITEQKYFEDKINYLSYYDALTGLPNRLQFVENLRCALENAKRSGRAVVILLLDLDNFKRINESLGFHAGDQLMVEVAKRLVTCTRSGDSFCRHATGVADVQHPPEPQGSVARLGGDEFVLLVPEIQRQEDAVFLAKRISDTFSAPFTVEGSDVFLTASIGIGGYPSDGLESEVLLKHAQAALNHAKKRGRNQYQFFKQPLDARARNKLSLEAELRKAVDRNEFVVHYQPRLDLRLNSVVAVEALVRWQHPDRGLIYPDEFIRVAEDTGVIGAIGEAVLYTACLQTTQFHKIGLHELVVSVNLSAAEFNQNRPTQRIVEILASTKLAPSYVELELTEGLLLNNMHSSLNTLHELREHGLGIAVDDFGTGYSSLSYLKRLPVSALKIDQSFVNGIGGDDSDAAIIEAIISLAHNLCLKLVAEGVEKPNQLEFLQARGCDEVQGYLICKPVTAEDFCDWMLTTSNVDAPVVDARPALSNIGC